MAEELVVAFFPPKRTWRKLFTRL